MLSPIGRFARASRLSIPSLRRYDESGLLPAAFVDHTASNAVAAKLGLDPTGKLDDEGEMIWK